MKKVLILAPMHFNQRAAIEAGLSRHSVQFMGSVKSLIARCSNADIIAVGTDHEKHLPELFEKGFEGIVIPLLVGKKQEMVVKGKAKRAIAIREILNTLEPEETTT